ncbi:sugar ABC transporter permease [Shinella yambaruensis]|uniref:ABC transporter permease n=1 Tax=Shinella yambaruensis TaxID=415996 RepID=A0ABQ5ZGD6_9HYPH|nr:MULTISPECIES: sugar ABC transporter permease [Shinella]CAI0335514.1 ABC transporter permease [Rhizobiaceae bacterium]CAK7259820.1 multiple sugar transport system permease protein [Shinella sp. WSC3-e]MCJ8024810.1 sugar ABC transporter permease [Shinella yambaruensis]MCO5137624.1 sugar ABC transporter permease [Shinella sp.]MCU7979263.1 sugar ABC transporter permease [Shinella yambaruensis]
MIPGSTNSQGRQLAALSAPAVLFTVAMIAFPVVYTIWLGFHAFSSTGEASFAGGANYAALVADGEFWNGLYVTFALYALSMVLQLVAGIYLAMLLFHSKRLSGLLRSLLISPFMMPPVVAGMMWLVILDPSLGAANYILVSLGLPASEWLASPTWVIPTIALIDTWQWAPYVALIVLGGLQSLPPSVYEAAQIDGASPFRIFRRITLPLLLPTIVTAAVLRSVDLLRFFDIIYITTQGGPGNASNTLNIYGFRVGFEFFNIGYASALMITLSAIVLAAVLVLNRLRNAVAW